MHNKFHQLSKHLLVVLLTVVVASAQAQPPTTTSPPPQGLLSRLIEIKYTSELYLSTRLKSEGLSTAQKDTTLATYNTLRLKVDGFVYHLSSEMITHNSPREFKKINEWCLQGKGNTAQVEALEEIENFYATNIKPVMITKTKTLNLTTNVFYLLKDSYTIVKGMSDMKTQKTMALIELLDHTRLLSPGEVGKMMGLGK